MAETEPTKRDKPGPASALDTEPRRLARGTLIDRYIVLGVLGAGGMGVVYSAFDPELDRKVAIKVLQTTEPAASGDNERDTEPLPNARTQAWLLREAQAMARLSHPNVANVHDVGSLPGGGVFIAMELVDGPTLRAWLAAQRRSWRDVIAVMRAAGAGLWAAHKAGLVHRDFKPENVIVGSDGRVRVLDFGLARVRPRHRTPDVTTRATPLPGNGPLVSNEVIAGTPAYMAPEVSAGRESDAKADQFSFGVVLYEALFGKRPFTPDELASPQAPAKLPEKTDVPAAIERVVLRTLSIDAQERYPSMSEVLAELAIDPMRRRRQIALAAGVFAVAVGAVGVTAFVRGHADELCRGTERRLDGVWDRKLAAQAKAAFLARKEPFAARSFAGVERALDAYAAQWVSASVENCRDTRSRRVQSEAVMTLRSECLDQRREELRTFTQLVVGAQGNLVEKGDKAVFELEPIAKCANVTALREPGAPPPEKRAQIEQLQTQVATAKAELIAGRYPAALAAASTAVERATSLGWQPLIADALIARGGVHAASGKFTDAEQTYSEATWAAMRGRRDDLTAIAALDAAIITAQPLGNPDKATVWLSLGIASANRAGVDRTIEQRRYEAEGQVRAESGDLLRAMTAHEKALALAELAVGKDSPALYMAEELVATTYTKAGAFGKAIPHYEHALALRLGSVGPDHYDISVMQSNLGVCYQHVRDYKKARVALERALAIRERLYGSESPRLIVPLVNLADLTGAEGNVAASLPLAERAANIAAKVPGKTHPMYHQAATERAELLIKARRFADARAVFDEVLSLEEANHSPALALTQSDRAELALAEHAWTDAEAWASRAIADFEAKGGAENPLLWLPLTRLAEAKLGQGKPAAARPLLERAIAIAERVDVTPADLERARTAYAKTR